MDVSIHSALFLGSAKQRSEFVGSVPCGVCLVFFFPIARNQAGRISILSSGGHPRSMVSHGFGRLETFVFVSFSVSLAFSDLSGKAGFLPGVALPPLLELSQAFTRERRCFLVYEVGSLCPRGISTKIVVPSLGYSSFEAFLSPPIHRLGGRRGLTGRWLSLPLKQGALASVSSLHP